MGNQMFHEVLFQKLVSMGNLAFANLKKEDLNQQNEEFDPIVPCTSAKNAQISKYVLASCM